MAIRRRGWRYTVRVIRVIMQMRMVRRRVRRRANSMRMATGRILTRHRLKSNSRNREAWVWVRMQMVLRVKKGSTAVRGSATIKMRVKRRVTQMLTRNSHCGSIAVSWITRWKPTLKGRTSEGGTGRAR